MDRLSIQSRDRRVLQSSLHFSCKSIEFMFSLLENMKAHIATENSLVGWVHTNCCYAMGNLRRGCVGSVDDGQLSTKIDQGSMRQRNI